MNILAYFLLFGNKNFTTKHFLIKETKFDSTIYIMVGTLEYLKRGGRITPAAAALGELLNLKPVLQIQGEKLDAFAEQYDPYDYYDAVDDGDAGEYDQRRGHQPAEIEHRIIENLRVLASAAHHQDVAGHHNQKADNEELQPLRGDCHI